MKNIQDCLSSINHSIEVSTRLLTLWAAEPTDYKSLHQITHGPLMVALTQLKTSSTPLTTTVVTSRSSELSYTRIPNDDDIEPQIEFCIQRLEQLKHALRGLPIKKVALWIRVKRGLTQTAWPKGVKAPLWDLRDGLERLKSLMRYISNHYNTTRSSG
jgi:hypothetical protein